MQSPRTIRSLGVLMIALGLILGGSMGYLIHWLQQALAQATPGRWTGAPEFTRNTFGLFYSILAFGGVSFCAGFFQLSTGRRSRLFMVLSLATLLPIVYFVARVIQS